ncbi:MAG: hypothetical protein A2021_03905 [Elusimicrobia bacterium GWF2_52_66]|nr:MAG: hypothetical protein A2X33_10190 [Elusimicrobia bacterium GWA2_51_34]OGR84732.1 MAG: hypothetical protein A2021_03905 [Elusimicrobia bacterium GWF2_52_66]
MANTFTSVRFMTAGEKWLVLSAWKRFIRNGLRQEDFSERLYKHLTLHCSFIAHYSRAGFYQHYFTESAMTLKFLSQFDQAGPCWSVEYGGEDWLRNGNDVSREYYDINGMMVRVGALFIPDLQARSKEALKESDLTLAKVLLEKHGYGLNAK